jgi:hypothetical protein
LARPPELKSRLLKEFWYEGEKIYEMYEIDRSSPPIRNAQVLNSPIQLRKETVIDLSPFTSEQAHLEVLDESDITADFQLL